MKKILLVVIALLTTELSIASECELCETGKRIYTQGIGSDNKPLSAVVQGDVKVTGQQLSCISCHRRSGLGASESNVFIPPITAEKLFSPKEQRRQAFYQKMYQQQAQNPALRPAYTDETLIKAITDGVRPDGHPLSMLMPKFQLQKNEQQALLAYLKSLNQNDAPGVDKEHLHFATIIGPDVSPAREKAVTQILHRYFEIKNAATRGEDKRAANPFWFKRGNWDAYRKWKLHVWKLQGEPETWGHQLNEFYTKENIFAVLSPIAETSWKPVHQFCEKNKIPCLWPHTDTPYVEGENLFSIYFSKGMALESDALIKKTGTQSLLQVTGGDRRSKIAAERNAKNYPSINFTQLLGTRNKTKKYQNIALWLTDDEIKKLVESGWQPPLESTIFLSASLSTEEKTRQLLGKGFTLYRHSLPEIKTRGQKKAAAWLKQQAIELTHPTLQTDTYFACTLLTGTVKKLQDVYSRQYLIEKIEHMTENSVSTASYSHLSLAPDQRFASKGVYFLPFGDNKRKKQWIVP